MKYRIIINAKSAFLAPKSATVTGFLGDPETVEVTGLSLSHARIISRATGKPFYPDK
jgi:hypothetical protein